MLDLKGRQVRTSPNCEPPSGVEVEMGDEVEFKYGATDTSTTETIYFDMDDLTKTLRPGDSVVLNDGELGATVLEVSEIMMKLQIKEAGVILPYKQIRIPGHRLATLPILRQED